MPAIRSSRPWFTVALLVVGGLTAIAAGLASALNGTGSTRALLCALQVVSLVLLARSEIDGGRGWATASFVVAAAWAALFTVPSVAYTVDPSLFDVGDLTGTIAVVTLGTVALLAGYVAFAADRAAPRPTTTIVTLPAVVHRRTAAVLYGLGLLALVVIVQNAGGPAEYLRSLNRTAGANSGLFYVVAVLLLLRWVPIAILAQRWGSGRPAGRWTVVAFVIGTLLLGLTGARAFVAIAFVEVALLWTLLRRPVSTVRVVSIGLVAGLLLVFGGGTVKRYQSSRDVPGARQQSFLNYATTTAPDEFVAAYVNNYVDTVRLMGLARATVPLRAPYEGTRPLKELVLKPLPSRLRPAIPRSPTVSSVFAPIGDSAYAIPVQANALLAGGPWLVLLVAAAIGALVRAVDRRILRVGQAATWKLLLLVSVIVQLPIAIRSGIPNGVALFLTEVIGTAVAARLILRRRTGETAGPPTPPVTTPPTTEGAVPS